MAKDRLLHPRKRPGNTIGDNGLGRENPKTVANYRKVEFTGGYILSVSWFFPGVENPCSLDSIDGGITDVRIDWPAMASAAHGRGVPG